jgi:hypothetical protein
MLKIFEFKLFEKFETVLSIHTLHWGLGIEVYLEKSYRSIYINVLCFQLMIDFNPQKKVEYPPGYQPFTYY